MATDPLLSPSATFSWNDRNLSEIEQIAEGVTMQWLEHGRIVCFTLNTVARAAIDAWLDRSYEIVKGWPPQMPYLALQDVSRSMLTPYTRERSAATVALTPEYLRGRSAVVMPHSVMNQAIRLFVTINLARSHANIQRAVFLDRGGAVRWLLAYQAEQASR